jgi:hypothetical protein
METKKRIAKFKYRSGRYGKWSPCSIVIPKEVGKHGFDLLDYIKEDLKKTSIKYTEIEIDKIINA